MGLIEKATIFGVIYAIGSGIYSGMPSTKKKLQKLDDQELFQKNEKFNMLKKIFLLSGFFAPVILIIPLFFISLEKAMEGYLAFLVILVVCANSNGMLYWNFEKITKAEIKYRKFKKKTHNNSSEGT